MRIRPASIGAALAVLGLLAWLALQDPAGRDPSPRTPPPSPGDPAADPGPLQEHAGASSLPCAVPMAWRIARVDPGFGLSPEEARLAFETAAELWAEAVGRPLFTYDEVEGFPVRFVFDGRQERTRERMRREGELRQVRQRLEAWEAELDERAGRESERELAEERARFHRLLRDHDRQLEELVRAFPPRPVEAGLHREAVVTEGGRVVSVSREIRVFQFENRDALVRVLAHELGHALGLGHAPDPGAVMSGEYGRKPTPSDADLIGPADVELLRDRCPGL